MTSTDLGACPSRTLANNNGQLVCGIGGYGIGNQLPRGSWRSSCRNASDSGGTIYAQCATTNGYWRDTSIFMDTCPSRILDNANGYLVCRGGQGGYRSGDHDGDRDDNNRD